ncbi:hypothetical protein ABZ801_16005 [Actinomadura sp. NPDC047616]|uniref:hypothetical protein n=1 Tax=Actinomadura sp. NPDC047616 TaxID=3155914 RepID=UPI003401857D
MTGRNLSARLADAEARELARQTVITHRQADLVQEAVANAADALGLPEAQRTRLIRAIARELRKVAAREGE